MQQIRQRNNDDAVMMMMMMINHFSIYLHPSVDGSLAAIAWCQKKEGKNENKIPFSTDLTCWQEHMCPEEKLHCPLGQEIIRKQRLMLMWTRTSKRSANTRCRRPSRHHTLLALSARVVTNVARHLSSITFKRLLGVNGARWGLKSIADKLIAYRQQSLGCATHFGFYLHSWCRSVLVHSRWR